MPEVHIEQITPQLTWQLRRDVLAQGQYKHNMGLDNDSEGTHFGAFFENKLAGVVSLFSNGTDFQLRKFAVDTAMQRQSIGTQLLDYMTSYAAINGATRLWCNARTTAMGFYAKAGFNTVGDIFTRGDHEYVIMEKTTRQKTGL